MPQLDTTTFISQILSLILMLTSMYTLITVFFLPKHKKRLSLRDPAEEPTWLTPAKPEIEKILKDLTKKI